MSEIKHNVAKCGDCPFYFPDSHNYNNSCCRYGGGWGWGLLPNQECHFGRSLYILKSIFKNSNITW